MVEAPLCVPIRRSMQSARLAGDDGSDLRSLVGVKRFHAKWCVSVKGCYSAWEKSGNKKKGVLIH
ncbi:MAG: hypothetical protein IMF18_05650 [Proteobacteria bacterium]|nr:hypothetical protein [Pseudomonadota bacterium]